MEVDPSETEILESVERGEWPSLKGAKRDRNRHAR
jgi:hypothetical protein